LIDKSRENGEVSYFLSEKGQNLFGLSIIERQLKLIELILSHFVFNKVLKLYFKKAEAPNSHEIVQLMKESNLYNINSDITFYRRSSTILSWINWVLEQVEE